MTRNSAACRFLRLLLEEKNWELLSEGGFSPTNFTGDAKLVYEFVRKYYNDHGEFPPLSLVQEQTLVTLPDLATKQYVFNELREFIIGESLKELHEEIRKKFQAGIPPSQIISEVRIPEFKTKKTVSFRETGLDRISACEQRKLRGISGVVMPWATLTDIYHRWENGTLTSILGMMSVGKSWLSCVIALHAFLDGEKVLLISMENSIDSFGRRLDALLYKIPFEDVRTGDVDFRQLRSWKESAEQNLTGDGDIILVDETTVKTLQDVTAMVNSLKPTLVVIDGGYKLESDGGEWKDSRQLVEGLHLLAKEKNIPIIASNQLNPEDKKKKMSGYDRGYKVRYAKEWVLVPDAVISLIQDDDDRLFSRATVQIGKIREAGDVPGKLEFKINCNRTKMDFSEIMEDEELEIEY